LALSERRFTWASSAEKPTFEKLDRILVITDWEQNFPISMVEALTRELSDHTPLLLNTGDTAHRGNTHQFKFELGWLTRDGFHDMVAKVWKEHLGEILPCNGGRIRLGLLEGGWGLGEEFSRRK
jgi:hypothetical protein